ncbi:SoxR reducing system RseC family protein [Clostridium sp. MB40-C1]|uniref:SoxR reducing system RseC family protein n=1 Tax=Clostridium sp. MB40-C1 TaxID=3070996 RepID=UPI0027E18999|nr:SoxR reducing system RseC family protein [Clostridium sp. MB40-C1]WMJ82357.1 SoxR reducing system RseC family protein [Clostridium sp. MB40-C1]
MTEIGYITSVHGEYASVIFKRKSGCGDNCASCKSSCGGRSSVTTEIENVLNGKTGDKVKISIEEKAFNKMIIWVYVFPLIMMFVGIGSGINIFRNMGYSNYELFSFLLGMLFLAISYGILNILNRSKVKNKEIVLKMIEIIKD